MTNNETFTKHSPLPWKMEKDGRILSNRESPSCIGIFQGLASTEKHIEEHKFNNKFIVTACNNHYELLEALEDAENALMNDLGYFERQPGSESHGRAGCTKRAIERIRAVLSQAKGKNT